MAARKTSSKKKNKKPRVEYNSLMGKTFADWLQSTGDIDLACSKIGISKRVYNNWLKKYPEFAQLCTTAETIFRDSLPVSLKAAAMRALTEAVHGRQTETETYEETEFHPGGVVAGYTVRTKTKTLLPPRWAIERVLGPSNDELSALQILVQNEWLDSDTMETIMNSMQHFHQEAKAAVAKGNPNLTLDESQSQ